MFKLSDRIEHRLSRFLVNFCLSTFLPDFFCSADEEEDRDDGHWVPKTPKDTDHWKDGIGKLYKIPTSIKSDNIV